MILVDNFNTYYSGKEVRINAVLHDYEPKKDYILLKDDILNPDLYKKLDPEIDYIFHLAAQASVRYSINHASEVSRNNIIGTINHIYTAKR